MEAILARRFSPFNFSVVPGFPNVVPTIDEWGDYLPRFREDKDDNPADHLLEFHEVMHQLGIHHEDVLMKMFMYSLEGYAREWYRSLPPASISSLKKFHATFSDHCKRFFPTDLLFENCCEEFDLYMQNSIVGSSSSMNEKEVNVKQVEEESSPCEIFSSFSIQEEIFIDCSDDKKVDQNSVETFDIISDISNNVCDDEIVAPKVDIDQATIMQSISQGCHEMEDFEVQVSGIFKDQPIYDKSPDDEEQISTMIQMELLSSNPIYENYEADYLESSGGYDIEITKKHLGFWYELNMHHDFQDPVATCMELVFLEVLNVTTFSMQSSCSCKYKLPIQFPLKKYLYFCVLLFSCKKQGYVVRHLLAWLYWQFHVT
jgi:hypothetical protein